MLEKSENYQKLYYSFLNFIRENLELIMPKIEVRNGDVEQALRNFKRITSETRKNSKDMNFI